MLGFPPSSLTVSDIKRIDTKKLFGPEIKRITKGLAILGNPRAIKNY